MHLPSISSKRLSRVSACAPRCRPCRAPPARAGPRCPRLPPGSRCARRSCPPRGYRWRAPPGWRRGRCCRRSFAEISPRALRGDVYSECVQTPLPRMLRSSHRVTRKSAVPSSSRMPPVVLFRPAALREPLSVTPDAVDARHRASGSPARQSRRCCGSRRSRRAAARRPPPGCRWPA